MVCAVMAAPASAGTLLCQECLWTKQIDDKSHDMFGLLGIVNRFQAKHVRTEINRVSRLRLKHSTAVKKLGIQVPVTELPIGHLQLHVKAAFCSI